MVARRRRVKLVTARKAAGYTQEGLAEALHVDRATVIRWEAGRHAPWPYMWPKLGKLLGVSRERLQELLAEEVRPDVQPIRLFGPATTELTVPPLLTGLNCDDHGRVVQEDDDVNRRTLLHLLGSAALLFPVGQGIDRLRLDLDDMLLAEPTSRDADDWEESVDVYAHDVGVLPAAQLLGDLLADFAEIQVRIGEANGLVRTKLVHSGAQMAALTAIALLNAGDARSAERWWRTAARAAQTTGDPQLVALIDGRHAIFSLRISSPARVLRLAHAAVAVSQQTPCVGAISGLAAMAQTLAEQGRDTEALRVVDQIMDMFGRLPAAATNDPKSQWNWAEQRFRHVESHVHAHVGRLEEAMQAQDIAIGCYPDDSFQGPAQVEFHRTTALVRAGDLDTATNHLVGVLERLQPWQRADGLVFGSARAALNTVPQQHRAQPNVVAATAFVDTIAKES